MCQSCEVLNINGVNCHEHGCPDAYRDESRECAECGSKFAPDAPHQKTCSHGCYVAFCGLDCRCAECELAYT